METFLIGVHSWLRWVVLILGWAVVVRAALGVAQKKPWTPLDKKIGTFFVASFDSQMVIGAILLFLVSPLTQAARADMAATMSNPILRFFTVEHGVMMLVAMILVHVGRVLAKKTDVSLHKHRRTLIFLAIAMLIVMAAIPWPGMPQGRPLFRF